MGTLSSSNTMISTSSGLSMLSYKPPYHQQTKIKSPHHQQPTRRLTRPFLSRFCGILLLLSYYCIRIVWKSCCQLQFPRARVEHMHATFVARKVKVHGPVAQHTRTRDREEVVPQSIGVGAVQTVKMSKQLVKLSEESLMREPEEVFDLLEKIGEG